jgi:hypothetical protein
MAEEEKETQTKSEGAKCNLAKVRAINWVLQD